MSCRTQGGISRCLSIRPSVFCPSFLPPPPWPLQPQVSTFKPSDLISALQYYNQPLVSQSSPPGLKPPGPIDGRMYIPWNFALCPTGYQPFRATAQKVDSQLPHISILLCLLVKYTGQSALVKGQYGSTSGIEKLWTKEAG